jgi:cytochrome c553
MKVALAVAIIVILTSLAYQADAVAPGKKVSEAGNMHNLSASNAANPYHATSADPRGQQVCIFCHTPHNANVSEQAPLWNRNFSTETFQRYTGSTQFQIKNIAAAEYGAGAQPNGSSKLCLSCHDGVSRLGAINNGAEIPMSIDVISGRASFKATTNKMRYGHHPVSFVYNASVRDSINSVKSSYALPTLPAVKRDKQERMQCTTCHDAHQNQSHDDQCYGGTCDATNTIKKVPFWVYGGGADATADQQAVCTTCHPMDAGAGFTGPWP